MPHCYAGIFETALVQGAIRNRLGRTYACTPIISEGTIAIETIYTMVSGASEEAAWSQLLARCTHLHNMFPFLPMNPRRVHLALFFAAAWDKCPSVGVDLLCWWRDTTPSTTMNVKTRRRSFLIWAVTTMNRRSISPWFKALRLPGVGGKCTKQRTKQEFIMYAAEGCGSWERWLYMGYVDALVRFGFESRATVEAANSTYTLATLVDTTLYPPKATDTRPPPPSECCVCLSEGPELVQFHGMGVSDNGVGYSCSHQVCCAECSLGLNNCPLCHALLSPVA
jgi:hypothetical protein